MPIAMEGRVGPGIAADGSMQPPRLSSYLSQVMSHLGGKYQESVLRGNVYSAATAAGVAPGTAISTTTPYTLYNPKGSGKALVVLVTSMSYVSGTLGAGTVHYGVNNNPDAAPATGTAIESINCLIGAAAGVGKALTTATVPANPTAVRPFASLTALLASTAVQPWLAKDAVDGEFAITPGCSLSFCATAAAGSSPVVIFGMTWEEVPFSL